MAWFRRKSSADPAATMRALREKALTVRPAELNLAPSRSMPVVWGALMETGYGDAVASLVVLADGTTSLYISSGGGVIGAGKHAPVRAASERLLEIASSHAGHFAPTQATPLPDAGRVRFYLRTFGATLTAEAEEEELVEGNHPLSAVFYAGQAVITEMRQATEGAEG